MSALVWEYITDLVTSPGEGRVVPGQPELREMWSFATKLPRVSVKRKIVADIVRELNPGTTGGLSGMRPEVLQLALRANFAMDVLHAVIEAGCNGE